MNRIDDEIPQGDMEAVLDFANRHIPVQLLDIGDGRTVAALHEGQTLQSVKPLLDEYREFPERVIGTAQFTDEKSFITHVNRHRQPASVLFASEDPARPSLLAVYDYHDPGTGGRIGQPRHSAHRSTYVPPLSPEWVAWTTQQKKGLVGPQDFAEFIEGRIMDIVSDPLKSTALTALQGVLGGALASAAKLVELSRGLSINVSEVVKTATNLSSGEISIVYEQAHNGDAGGSFKVPSLFAIGIPVFRGGTAYQIAVRLRYRINTGKVTWAIELYRPELTWDAAFTQVLERVTAETTLPVLLGTPEAAA